MNRVRMISVDASKVGAVLPGRSFTPGIDKRLRVRLAMLVRNFEAGGEAYVPKHPSGAAQNVVGKERRARGSECRSGNRQDDLGAHPAATSAGGALESDSRS